MPLYEYQCDKCHKVFEVMQKFSDAPLTVHENCGGNLNRLISAPAIQFKGSGWYVTDYAGKSGNGGAKKKESESKGTSDSSTKSDSKATDTKSSGDSSTTGKKE